jgi:hypothetical protein
MYVSARPLGILHKVTPAVSTDEITVEKSAGCGLNVNIQVGVSRAMKEN